MSLIDKLKKNSIIKETDILETSKIFNKKDLITTKIPALNIAFSGQLDGGFTPGVTMWCGPSKHFKTGFALLMAKAYMDKYPESVLLFYDSEFGANMGYFNSFGIEISRVIHTPVMNIEQLKFDCVTQLEGIERTDKLIIVIDSIGNIASKKEIEDAIDGKSVADMSRAKQIKSFFRMVTPYLSMKDIPMVVINHSYKEMSLFPKDIVSGGTGSYYAADNIYMLGRQQDKEGQDLSGYNFIINVEKSRYTREKSKIPITIKFDGGISIWSGLLEIALESGHIVKNAPGWYTKVDSNTGELEDKKFRSKDTDNKEFWDSILDDVKFQEWIRKNYQISNGLIIQEDIYEI